MDLPLLQHVKEDGDIFRLTLEPKFAPPAVVRPVSTASAAAPSCGLPAAASPALIPDRKPSQGEQYRFHFDMTSCIGCKCCVVACNEQNGNPADINWRRVGEIEGGSYPDTSRFYLSMGCNQCVDPTCLPGCPVDAYTKDGATGIVLHSADLCIGCQYCTWNCSYGVPQYNPERGVVGKCDMCHDRLDEGRAPACVGACPEQAIQIEIVNIAEWTRDYAAANAPGMPSADDSVSSTRITLPARLPRGMQKVDAYRVAPEKPHWPLVLMTVLTQTSVGALGVLFAVQCLLGSSGLHVTASIACLVAAVALAASTLHLGRPIHAYRALRMWRRSWLSREVLLFSIFSGMAFFYAALLWIGSSFSLALGACTLLSGLGGMYASARLYLAPARPAWNSRHTIAEFYLTGALLGLLFVAAMGAVPFPHAWVAAAGLREIARLAALAGIAVFLQQTVKLLWLMASDNFELRATGRLLSTALRGLFLWRLLLLLLGGVVLPLVAATRLQIAAALGIAVASEVVGRYLFFVSVVPKNIAASYLRDQEVA